MRPEFANAMVYAKTASNRIPVDDLRADPETRLRNAQRNNRTTPEGECFLCGRGLTASAIDKAWWIHMHTGGTLIPNDENVDDSHGSQGCFPIGSECAKRVPRTHRAKYTQ